MPSTYSCRAKESGKASDVDHGKGSLSLGISEWDPVSPTLSEKRSTSNQSKGLDVV